MNTINIIPAIDLKNGRCVRLQRGQAAAETVYADDPVKVALAWQKQGATRLHVVDLDGAFAGRPVHTATILSIAQALKIPVQTGGGLRDTAQIQHLLDNGVDTVVLGTSACLALTELSKWLELFGARLAVGLDAHDGRVSIKGWTQTTNQDALALAQRLDCLGVKTLIYTDIMQDGMLQGPNLEAVRTICERVGCNVIASGGITSAADVKALQALAKPNLRGAIVGKALYEERVSLKELQNQ